MSFEYFPYAKHCVKLFICIIYFNEILPTSLQSDSIDPFYRWVEWGLERFIRSLAQGLMVLAFEARNLNQWLLTGITC